MMHGGAIFYQEGSMKAVLAALAASGLFLSTVAPVQADGVQISPALQGMATGALIGSVFGPDTKHRVENAAIGGVAGLMLGAVAGSEPTTTTRTTTTYSYPSYSQQTTVYYPQPQQQVVVGTPIMVPTYPAPQAVYIQPAPAPVVTYSYPVTSTVVVGQSYPSVIAVPSRPHHSHHHGHQPRLQYVNGMAFPIQY
ncbi:MAG: hypothetical protein HQL56_03960 [Magnetococcales bacterium]|nr:hypothetical protein [Magnetococcales bacterium]